MFRWGRKEKVSLALWLLVAALHLCAPGDGPPVLRADPVSLIITAVIYAGISYGLSSLAASFAPKPNPVEINKADPRLQTSEYGAPIPRVYGTVGGVAGSVVWATQIVETRNVVPGRGGKRRTPDQISYSYSLSLRVHVCKGPIQGITKITADTQDVLYTGAATGAEVEFVAAKMSGGHIYLGTETQLPDPFEEADKGVGNVPAYRGVAGVVLRGLVLDTWGNRIPNLTFEVVQGDGTLSEIVIDECALVGLAASDLDATQLATETLPGYIVLNREPVRASLEKIGEAFQVDFVEVDGKLKAVKRPQSSLVTIPADDLSAHSLGDEPPPRTETGRAQDSDLPRQVDVVYFDTGRNYERNTQSFRREIYSGYEEKTVSLPMCFTANRASRIAKVIAVTAWAERKPVSFSLPSKYLRYAPGDVVTVQTVSGSTFDVRIQKQDLATPGVIKCAGVAQFAEAYEQTGEGETGRDGSGTLTGGVYVPPVIPVDPVDPYGTIISPYGYGPGSGVSYGLMPEHAGQTGYYVGATPDAASSTSSNAEWKGASLIQQTDAEGGERLITTFTTPAAIGEVLNTLAGASGTDAINQIDVRLYAPSRYASLASITNDAFTKYVTLNRCAVGAEILQFRDAYQPDPTGDPRRWILSHLKRGLSGSPTAHSAGEKFILADAAVKFVPTPAEERATPSDYTVPTWGQNPGDGNLYEY